MEKRIAALLMAALLLPAFSAGQAEEEQDPEAAEKAAPEVLMDGDYTYTLAPDGTAFIAGYTGPETELALPAELGGKAVTGIGNRAFASREDLKSVIIPDGAVRIGNWAFFRCKELEKIVIPDSVTEVGYYAFYECSALAEITLPEKLAEIGIRAFAYCSALEEITVPESITRIGTEAFTECENLAAFIVAEGSYAEQYARNNSLPVQFMQDRD